MTEFEKIARPQIKDLPVYSPGMGTEEVRRRYGVEEVIKLASNENPLGPSPMALAALRDALGEVSVYPDGACGELRAKLSEKLGVAPERFIFGNGTDEVIDFVFFAFFNPGDAAVMGDPTFSSYYLSGATMGADLVYAPLRDHRHDVEAMLGLVTPTTRGLFVGSPHNPTGTICTREDLEMILGSLPGDVLLVWDEAYMEYVDDPDFPDSLSYIERYPNLIVLRTFSKCYGLAGLRVGYGVADPGVVTYLEKVRPPFNVNRLAQVAATAALDDRAHLERSRKTNAEGKAYLARELGAIGFEVVPTQANFMLVRFDRVVGELAAALLERGIIVRDGAALGYPGHIRLTVGTPEQNKAVVAAVRGIAGL